MIVSVAERGKIRVVFCRSNPLDPDPRVEKEAAALSRAGYEVKVIAWDRTGELPEQESRGGMTIHRLSIQADYGRGLGNLPALVKWLFGLTKWLINSRKTYDVIHACDFDTVQPALLCKFLFGKKVVYDIFDFYADHLRATPGWIKRLIRRLDFLAISWVDAVILVDESRREQLRGSQPKSIRIIYNSPGDIYNEIKVEGEEKEGGLDLVYVGLLQVERGLIELLEVMARYQSTLELTAGSDVSIATYDPDIPNHRYASPNKIFEAMMLAKPVIVARNTNMDQIIKNWDNGLVVTYGDLQDLERALKQLEEDPSLRMELGANGRRAYESQYSWSKMEERLLTLYEELD
jgi:glycosyltransferase involved in cell wall biosynthesis